MQYLSHTLKIGRQVLPRAALTLAVMLAFLVPQVVPARAAGPCDPPITNPVACENTQTGNPASEWDVAGAGDTSIQGFATDISVNKGQTISFKVNTPASNYRLDIYRLGYYGGLGARKITTLNRTTAQTQPSCLTNVPTGLVDCGNWAVSLTWSVPADAVSGIYVGKLVRADTSGASHIPFVVRDDSGSSPMLFQTSDTTWHAYNSYGGNSLYVGNPAGRAYKVSYNRPFNNRQFPGGPQESYLFNSEYPMVRWLERNGYNVSYSTGVDSDRRGAELLEHQVFLSVGHDEYWSGQQRANVEAARAAGKHLAFFSGNEVFWKHRWENSLDASGAPYRTLVSYKESHADAKIDPNPAWTGTWRDARFSPPADGGRPENALTGTLFKVNGIRNDTISVPAADGKMRFWRNTAAATLAPDQTLPLTAGTLGYEWDEDVDNSSRPAGAIRLSSTTVEVTNQYLLDEDNNFGAGTARHSLVLYRHGNALVFGAGTTQWSWGLEGTHDRGPSTPSTAMQQATVNLFADMGVQPGTLQAGLVAATPSTDTTRPTSSITSPTNGGNVTQATTVNITGTASDTGGQVGGVEVSTDGGTTWHPATGRANWSYAWTPTTTGPATIRARATDDSGNLQSTTTSISVTVQPRTCPCTIWPANAAPTVAASAEVNAVELGVKFRTDVAGYISGVRFYKGAGNTGTHVGSLWNTAGARLAQATFSNETATGWQQVNFASPVAVAANTTYIASYHAPNGHFAVDLEYFEPSAYDNAPLHALRDLVDGGNGVFRFGASAFPDQTYQASNYWVDVVFSTTPPAPDTTPPGISAVQATNVTSSGATVTWTTNEPANSQVEYGLTTSYGTSTTLDPALVTGHSVVLAGLSPSTTYNYRVKSRDAAGNPATSANFTFATPVGPAPPTCPCSIWSASATPAIPAQNDSNAVELGVKFRSDVAGYISGVRFYKGAGNTGTHVGSLWNTAGTRLAQATFAGETATGWQQVSFATPVAIAANTTYVASYHAPNGHYARTELGFSGAGVDNPPLHALANGANGPNGLYAYGPAGSFPTNSFNATNYWVDVVFTTTPPAPDTTPPTISGVSSSGVGSTGATIEWTTNELATSQVEYGPSFSLSSTLDPTLETSHSVALSGLTPSTAYQYRVKSRDAAGNLATSAAFNFTTTATPPPPTCPCSIFSPSSTPAVASDSETAAVELGVKFRSDVAGYITGVRFYKGPSNTGTHIGSLWSSTGTRLAQATFSGETATGWQQVSFATPVQISANTTYVASYHAPNGGFAVNRNALGTSGVDNGPLHALRDGVDGGNGVFRFGASGFPNGSYQASNYWVDVVFSTTPPAPDNTPPTISGVASSGISGSGAMIAWSTNELADSQVEYGTTTSYGSSTTLDPALVTSHSVALVGLNPSTLYHYRVKSKDAAGNLTTSGDFTFTTGAGPTCPCSIWSTSATPAIVSQSDTGAVELGVKFRSDSNGYIRGIRFYKGPANTGTHVGSLWSSTGTRLAHATFSGETATGWQTVLFATPVQVQAGVTYVASYHAPNGGYSRNEFGFTDASVDNAPLHALRSGTDGPNGLYAYGPAGSFPTNSYHDTNYWVDVVFALTP